MKRKRSSNHQEEVENIALEFQIGEISHFFDIPASTLRYWEEMQVLSPNKGETSHYREYAVEDLMTKSRISVKADPRDEIQYTETTGKSV